MYVRDMSEDLIKSAFPTDMKTSATQFIVQKQRHRKAWPTAVYNYIK